MTREELYAKLLLMWSRTIAEHGLTWEEWLTNAAYAR